MAGRFFTVVLWLGVGLAACSEEAGQEEVLPWSRCVSEPDGQTAALAAAYDEVARRQHIDPDGLLRNVWLSEDLQSVETYQHTENTILWTGIYLASQAFRYAVTGEAEAMENGRRAVEGLGHLTAVTGVSGLYGRCLCNPALAYPGCGEGNPGWSDSTASGYEGWRFRNDVSKDGYDGLMFGYAAAMEHFDDPVLLDTIRQRLRAIADHLVNNGLQIIDVDGQVTEHGAIYHSALDNYPGFNALLASSWIKVASVALQDPELEHFYDVCLMKLAPDEDCPDIELVELGSYISSMEDMLYLFLPDCKQSYDNFDMAYQAMYPLLRREQHLELRQRLLGVLRNNMFHTEDPDFQSLAPLGNAFYTFVYAALSGQGPDDALLDDAVDKAVCVLRQFPPIRYDRAIPAGAQEEVCRSRQDYPLAAETIPLDEYYFDNYLWRLDFFRIQLERPERRRLVYSPEDFLMAYWLGRLHGILRPED